MQRDIITIDEEKCNGCGQCIPGCPEGALQIVDGKARLISDLYCDGLGACIGECPQGAIEVETREAEPYNERKVMANIVSKGEETVKAHLHHLEEHGETDLLEQAHQYLRERGVDPEKYREQKPVSTGCPGAKAMQFEQPSKAPSAADNTPSALTHWPVQLHLINPRAPHFKKSDLLVAADCTAFSLGSFHSEMLQGKTLAVACPKLDSGQEQYLQKLTSLVDESLVNTITVLVMEVPCCGGLVRLVQTAVAKAERKVPVKKIVVSIKGDILDEQWL